MYLLKNIIPAFLALTLLSCGGDQSNTQETDTVGMGQITVTADPSLQPVVTQLQEMFEYHKSGTKIKLKFLPEQMAINQMLLDSARVAIVTRELSPNELQILSVKKITYKPLRVGIDALVLVMAKGASKSAISLQELKEIATGKNSSIELVVDNANSSNLKFFIDKLGFSSTKGIYLNTQPTTQAIVNYVASHANAIGLLGLNTIGNKADPVQTAYRQKVKYLAVSNDSLSASKPSEQALINQKYPLARPVYMLTKESRQGLGTGFINFSLGQTGQLIVEKTGMVPVYPPSRLYKVQN
jgi:phosphate transport system substrate-binding protein